MDVYYLYKFLIYLLVNNHRFGYVIWAHNSIRFTHLEKETNYPLRYLMNKRDDNQFCKYNYYYYYYYNSHSTVVSGEMDTVSNDNVIIIIAICNFWFGLKMV